MKANYRNKSVADRPPAERLCLDSAEAAAVLGIGLTKLRDLIASGELPTVRFGRALRIRVEDLQILVASGNRDQTASGGDTLHE